MASCRMDHFLFGVWLNTQWEMYKKNKNSMCEPGLHKHKHKEWNFFHFLMLMLTLMLM